ncbi:FAS1 domain-containing protein [Coprinopsis marcescibilis]|uniref:FAS1 domain-containing protein n=1 Tax=Coprinopsis marcescibilis TaxID=230819 RepID=A0A5C3KJ29_COPMA|nr:FAS1 domain-containing protein [Coprinopsis marcescibilis]
MVQHLQSLLLILAVSAPLLASSQTLTEVLSSRDDLSTLRTLVGQFPGLLDGVASAGGTILAPSNQAFANFLRAAGVDSPASLPTDTVRSLLTYHVLPQALDGETLSAPGGAVAETALASGAFANLGGGPNVLFASAYGSVGLDEEASGLKIYSGVGAPANVTTGDIVFNNGFVHVISSVLNLPQTPSQTAETAALTILLSALEQTNLTSTVDSTPRLTVFAPSDEAFSASGIDLSALSVQQLGEVLQYHTIVGDLVGYSTELEDGQEYKTLAGPAVRVHKRGGQLFVNDVAVALGNVITTNGVAHVLSGILLPSAPGAPSGPSSGTPTSGSSSTGISPSGGSIQTSQTSGAEAVSTQSTFYLPVLASVIMTSTLLSLA